MFKKLHNLHDESQYSLSYLKKGSQISYKKNFVKHNTDKKKFNSYGEKFRKKNHLAPTVPNLQIIESDSFIFQGRLASVIEGSSLIPSDRQKHGEGVMFLKNGTLIVGYWDHGFLHGKAIIFTPFGGKTIAEFYNGKLNGWTITLFADKLVVCAIYYENRLDGEKIIYEANQKMWVGSKYIRDTNSFKIIHLQKGKMNQLPEFIKFSHGSDLVDLYEQFVNSERDCLALKEIECIAITENLNYIGYCSEEGYPNGLGCIYGKKEFYMGHFRQGSLQCYGRMIFENGEIYQGQLLSGVFYGQGIYYNPFKNQSTIMSTSRQEQKILDEQQGYICINSSLNYFKYNKHATTGMVGDALAGISEIIEKYYSRQFFMSYQSYRFFIESKSNHADSYSANSEFGVSENADDIDELGQKGSQLRERKGRVQEIGKNSPEKGQQKPWLNFKEQSLININSPQIRSLAQHSHQQQSSIRLHRAYSMDKRQASNLKKSMAQQSIPLNLEQISRNQQQEVDDDEILQMQISKLKIDRNFSLNQKKVQQLYLHSGSTMAKENVVPQDGEDSGLRRNRSKKNTFIIGEKKPSFPNSQAMTFRNIKPQQHQAIDINSVKNQRKYSHLVESNANFSPSQSIVSNLSHKVEGMMKNTSMTKRKKIFM